MKPLTVGNVVSTGLQIYRDRFFDYFKLAFIGYLWLFVPFFCFTGFRFLLPFEFDDTKIRLLIFLCLLSLIYCLAKYFAILGLISRLAFAEVVEKPESIRDAQRSVKPKMWKFLIAIILVILIVFVAMIALGIMMTIIFSIFGVIMSLLFSNAIGQTANVLLGFISILLSLGILLLLLFSLTWLMSRFFIVEVSLAIEEKTNATDAIGRSWQLTKGSIFRLQLIIIVAFLISSPITIIIQIARSILQLAFNSIGSANPGLFIPFLWLLTLGISLAGGALLIPFWQSIKAVIYYDLRVRREGFGLNLEKS